MSADSAFDESCVEGARHIYAIDSENRLYRFEPTIASRTAFEEVGTIDCGDPPAGGYHFTSAIAIDRAGVAYVLIHEAVSLFGGCLGIFKVRTQDATCISKTAYQCGSIDVGPFDIAFASGTATSVTDTLYWANLTTPRLGRLDPMSGGIEEIGPLPGAAKLTGNHAGELWALFWTLTPPNISQIEESSGASLVNVPVPDLPNNSTIPGNSIRSGPAVAYWAGALYAFLEVSPQDTSTTVYKIPPSGVLTTHIADTGLHVLSAGVSSCAPAP